MVPANHVLSYQVRHLKPDIEIYKIAKNVAENAVPRITVSEILFIDDLTRNVDAAKEFGFDAVLYTDAEMLKTVFQERKLPV